MFNPRHFLGRFSKEILAINPSVHATVSELQRMISLYDAYFSNGLALFFSAASQTLSKQPAQGYASTPLNKRPTNGIACHNYRLAGFKIQSPL
jgi:uncharacterized membrane protein